MDLSDRYNRRISLNRQTGMGLILVLEDFEVRNALVDIQVKTGMDFYVQGKPWQEGKIAVDKRELTL